MITYSEFIEREMPGIKSHEGEFIEHKDTAMTCDVCGGYAKPYYELNLIWLCEACHMDIKAYRVLEFDYMIPNDGDSAQALSRIRLKLTNSLDTILPSLNINTFILEHHIPHPMLTIYNMIHNTPPIPNMLKEIDRLIQHMNTHPIDILDIYNTRDRILHHLTHGLTAEECAVHIRNNNFNAVIDMRTVQLPNTYAMKHYYTHTSTGGSSSLTGDNRDVVEGEVTGNIEGISEGNTTGSFSDMASLSYSLIDSVVDSVSLTGTSNTEGDTTTLNTGLHNTRGGSSNKGFLSISTPLSSGYGSYKDLAPGTSGIYQGLPWRPAIKAISYDGDFISKSFMPVFELKDLDTPLVRYYYNNYRRVY